MNIRIGKHLIGDDQPCFIIGEVAQAHDGSLGTAHAYIDAIANAGAHAVKFQMHIAEAESTALEPWRVKFSQQDATRYDYWRRMEFSEAQWRILKEHAEEKGLVFLCSPFSEQAVAMLSSMDIQAWKLASGEIGNLPLLRKILQTGKPVLLSTGMCTLDETDVVVDECRKAQVPYAVMQCTSEYPCPAEHLGLNLIPFFSGRYQCPVGLSDHTGTIYAGLAAAAVGASLLEVHVTFSRECFGPDVVASVTAQDLRQLVEGATFISRARQNPVNKDMLGSGMENMRRTFGKSIVAAMPLLAGTVFEEQHAGFKKPGFGLAPNVIVHLLGRRLKRNVTKDELLSMEDFEE